MKHYSLNRTILLLLLAMPTYPNGLQRQLLALGHACGKGRTITYHLKLLVHDGLATSAWEIPVHGRARLVYSITEAGLLYLQRVGVLR